jgi:iron complex outermembrane receptor protein
VRTCGWTAVALAITACAGAAAPVRAQEPVLVSEVLVTARRQLEPMLTVPVVETVLTQSTLQRLQVDDLRDIASLVPGLVIGNSLATIGTQVSLRGVGANVPGPAGDQPVALVIDGLQLSNGASYLAGVFDLGQVEVLKGPQALFYGKASTAGVISVRTTDPGDRFELVAQTGHEFEANEWRSEIIISGPVAPGLKLRLASLYSTTDGYFINAGTGFAPSGARDPASRTLFPAKGYQIRGTALFDPTPELAGRLKLNVAHDRMLYQAVRQYVLCPDGVRAPFGVPFIGGGEDCKLDRTYRTVDYDPAVFGGRVSGTPYLESTQAYGTLELTYRISPGLTLTSLTGLNKFDARAEVNGDNTTYAAPTTAIHVAFRTGVMSQEIRINSSFSKPVNFTFGAYYDSEYVKNLVGSFGNTRLGFSPVFANGSNDVRMETYSAFGQVRWKIKPSLEFAAGARWTDEGRGVTALDLTRGTPVEVPLQTNRIRSRNLSPELTLTYTPTGNITVFGALKQGYRSGSFFTTSPATPGNEISYGDEKVEGGEAGLKMRGLDGRLLADFAAYDYRYTDLQVPALITDPFGVPFGRIVNAGSALVYGVEFEAAYQPAELQGLSLHGSANWNHARFKSFSNAPCYGGQTIAMGCNQNFFRPYGGFTTQDLSGAPLVRAPEWTAVFGFDYEAEIGRGLTLIFSNSTQYSSAYRAELVFPYYQPAYVKTDLSLILRGPRGRWEFGVLGKNLGDKITAGSCQDNNAEGANRFGMPNVGKTSNGPAGVNEVACWVDRGREVWLRLTLRPFS